MVCGVMKGDVYLSKICYKKRMNILLVGTKADLGTALARRRVVAEEYLIGPKNDNDEIRTHALKEQWIVVTNGNVSDRLLPYL